MYKEKLRNYFKENQSGMIESLSEIVKIKSYQTEAKKDMPFGEGPYKALNKVLEMAKGMGFTVRNLDNYVGTIDLYQNKPAKLGILCHLDVVPEGDGWHSDPYTLTHKDGKLVGRGTIDDKGPAIAVLYALKAIKDLGINLSENVRLIVGTNEENGSADLEYYDKIEKMPHNLFTPDGEYPIINIEKGMLRINIDKKIQVHNNKKSVKISAGKIINAVPDFATAELKGFKKDEIENICSDTFKNENKITFSVSEEKDVLNLQISGVGAHASLPEKGVNALTALLLVMSKLDFEDTEISETIKGLSESFSFGDNNGKSAGIYSRDDISGETTCVLSIMNSDANRLNAKVDIRFPVCETTESIINKLSDKLKKYGINVNADMRHEAHHVEESSEFIQTLLKVYSDITGEKPYCKAIGGGTYVHNTKGGVAFGPEFPGEDNNMHAADEFITLESFLKNAEIFSSAIIELCK